MTVNSATAGLRLLFLGLLSTCAAPSMAGELTQDTGAWLQAVAEGSMEFIDPSLKNGRIWLEGQSRFDGNWDHWFQGMARTAVGYSLSDRTTVWAGYTWLPTQNIGKDYIAQQDIWPAFRYVLDRRIDLPHPIGDQLPARRPTARTLQTNDQIRASIRTRTAFESSGQG